MTSPMTIPADLMQVARNIMDNACLSEPYHVNGVVKALTDDIARAIMEERNRCVRIAENEAPVFQDMEYAPLQEQAKRIASAIRDEGGEKG